MNKSKSSQRIKMFFARPFQVEDLENRINDFLKEVQMKNEVVNVMQSVGLEGNYLLMTVIYKYKEKS